MINLKISTIAVAAIVCAVGIGCANTSEGVKKDADQTGEGVKQTTKNVVAAVKITPMVKEAIIADKELNNTDNMINVESKDNVVHLTGHVKSEEMKTLAGNVAQKVLDDNKATDKLSNELTVGMK